MAPEQARGKPVDKRADRDARTRLRDIGEARVALQRLDEPLDERAPRLGDRAADPLMWALMAGLVIACLIIGVLWPRGTRQGAVPGCLKAVPRQDLAGTPPHYRA
jgi:hypothetical protein